MQITNINIYASRPAAKNYPFHYPNAVPVPMQPNRYGRDITPEAWEIIKRLHHARTEDLRQIVWELFLEYFRDDIAGGRGCTDYRDAVFDVWKYYCR